MDIPAPILSIATVLDRSAEGGRGSLGGSSGVSNSVFTSVDSPNPDSPTRPIQYSKPTGFDNQASVPTTIAVNWKPLRTLFLWTWLGRLANPT